MSKRRKTRTRGLYLNEAGVYEIDKTVLGKRITGSTGFREGQIREAEQVLANEVERYKRAVQFGERPLRIYEELAAEYLRKNQHQSNLRNFAGFVERLLPYFAGVYIHNIHDDSPALNKLKRDLKSKGRKNKTINAYVEVLRRMLNQAQDWRDEFNMTWIERAPKFKMLPLNDSRPPRPITQDEEIRLLNELPEHLAAICRFTLSAGIRDWSVSRLKWDWMIETAYGTAFEIPVLHNKQKERGLIICNSDAMQVLRSLRGQSDFVFSYKGKPIARVVNSAWKKARSRADLGDLHFHDLRHTFGYRLREAGVDHETRQDLLRHTKSSITSHYSSADVKRLFEAAESIVGSNAAKPLLRVVRG